MMGSSDDGRIVCKIVWIFFEFHLVWVFLLLCMPLSSNIPVLLLNQPVTVCPQHNELFNKTELKCLTLKSKVSYHSELIIFFITIIWYLNDYYLGQELQSVWITGALAKEKC